MRTRYQSPSRSSTCNGIPMMPCVAISAECLPAVRSEATDSFTNAHGFSGIFSSTIKLLLNFTPASFSAFSMAVFSRLLSTLP